MGIDFELLREKYTSQLQSIYIQSFPQAARLELKLDLKQLSMPVYLNN